MFEIKVGLTTTRAITVKIDNFPVRLGVTASELLSDRMGLRADFRWVVGEGQRGAVDYGWGRVRGGRTPQWQVGRWCAAGRKRGGPAVS